MNIVKLFFHIELHAWCMSLNENRCIRTPMPYGQENCMEPKDMKWNELYHRGLYHVSFWMQFHGKPLDRVQIAFNFGHGGGKGPKVLLEKEIERLNLDPLDTQEVIRRIVHSSFAFRQEKGQEVEASWIQWNLVWRVVREFLPKDDPLLPRVLLAAIESNALSTSYIPPSQNDPTKKATERRRHFLYEIELDEAEQESPQYIIDYALRLGVTEKDLSEAWVRMVTYRADSWKTALIPECWEGLHIAGNPIQELCRPVAQKLLLREFKELLLDKKHSEKIHPNLWKQWQDLLACLLWSASADMAADLCELFVQSYANGTIGVVDELLGHLETVRRDAIRDHSGGNHLCLYAHVPLRHRFSSGQRNTIRSATSAKAG